MVTGDGVRLALHRRRPFAPGRRAVLLVHGAFTGHSIWLRTDAARGGLAHHLGERGWDVWLADLRGHGQSDREPRRFAWRFEDLIRHDAPALVAAVRVETGDVPLIWIGHSMGAIVGLCWIARQAPDAPLGGIVTLGAPGPRMGGARRSLAALMLLTCRVLGRFPARRLGLGSEDEAGGVLADWMAWNVLGQWMGDDGFDHLAALGAARTPFLSVAGAADRWFAPPAACRQIVERWGDARKQLAVSGPGIDHRGLLMHADAPVRCWPIVAGWLEETVPS